MSESDEAGSMPPTIRGGLTRREALSATALGIAAAAFVPPRTSAAAGPAAVPGTSTGSTR